MTRPHRRSYSAVPALAVLAFAGAGAVWWWSGADQRPAPIVFAGTGKWALKDLTWTENDGYWRVSATPFLVNPRVDRTNASTVAKGVCGGILVQLPGAPQGVTRKDVYRVTLNGAEYISNDKSKKSFWDGPLPVQVRDGGCLIKGLAGEYFFTYPGELENWELTQFEMIDRASSEPALVINLVRTDPESGQALPYLKACNAVFDDPPPHLGAVIHTLESQGKLAGLEVQMYDVERRKPLAFKFTMVWSYKARYVDGSCIPFTEGEAS